MEQTLKKEKIRIPVWAIRASYLSMSDTEKLILKEDCGIKGVKEWEKELSYKD